MRVYNNITEVFGNTPLVKLNRVLDGAKAVLLYMDGGDKLAFLEPARWVKMQALAESAAMQARRDLADRYA